MNITLLVLLTATLVGTAAGLTTCVDVCPNVKNSYGCAYVNWWCPDPTKCGEKWNDQCNPRWKETNLGGDPCSSEDDLGICNKGLKPPGSWCPSYCKCNLFYTNCEPCHGCGPELTDASDGGIFSIAEGGQSELSTSTSCDEYEEWMNLPKEEKVKHLDKYYCSDDLEVHPDIHAILENLADSNDDGHFSCEEFNNAYNLEGMLERKRRLRKGEDVLDSHVFCLTPDGTDTSKSGKKKGRTSKTAKMRGKV
jgi:hypothetical protein